MDTNNEILDAIEILADKKIGENITKILTGICKSVNINNNTCVMDSNGVISTVQFYGSPPEVNELYRIFVPSNNMSRSFIVVPPKLTVNPNLFDNWYFGNPVNQRGLTEYTGISYTVDRWVLANANMSVKESVLSISSVIYDNNFSQRMESKLWKYMVGKTITISIMVKNVTGKWVVASGNNKIYGTVTEIGLHKFTDKLIESATDAFHIFSLGGEAGSQIDILAIKLELGSTQTLAHFENGNWVLNEIPDYSEQLRKCQRYYYQVHYVQYQTINMAYEDTAYAFLMLPLPVEMRLKYPVMTQSTPILLGTSEKTLVSAEVSGCMARLGLNYDAMANPSRSCYSYCPNVGGVTFTFSAEL